MEQNNLAALDPRYEKMQYYSERLACITYVLAAELKCHFYVYVIRLNEVIFNDLNLVMFIFIVSLYR